MESLFVRLKPLDVRRGHVLRRFTYLGIQFEERRGWVRVEPTVAEYLRSVRQVDSDPYAPAAFDVCTETEARALEATEAEDPRRRTTDNVPLVTPRASGGVPAGEDAPKADEKDGRRGKREKE